MQKGAIYQRFQNKIGFNENQLGFNVNELMEHDLPIINIEMFGSLA